MPPKINHHYTYWQTLCAPLTCAPLSAPSEQIILWLCSQIRRSGDIPSQLSRIPVRRTDGHPVANQIALPSTTRTKTVSLINKLIIQSDEAFVLGIHVWPPNPIRTLRSLSDIARAMLVHWSVCSPPNLSIAQFIERQAMKSTFGYQNRKFVDYSSS